MGGHDEGPAYSGGVRVFSIGGRMVDQRERLSGMSETERRWRAQFLKDQALEPTEPRFSPEYFKATNNILVRLYRMPMGLVQKAVTPFLGKENAFGFRIVTGRLLAFYFASLFATYYFKYNTQDWTRTGGWLVMEGKKAHFPGDPDYPNVVKKEKTDYADLGFSKSIFW